MLALLQPEEVSDRQLPLSVYVPFVQGFNGVYIFFQAVVESKAFLVPWTRSDREMELAQSVSQWKCCVGVAGGEGGYFVFQVKWKQIKVDFFGMEVLAVCSGRTMGPFPGKEGRRRKGSSCPSHLKR